MSERRTGGRSASAARRRPGFGLVEIMVTISISLLVLGMAWMMWSSSRSQERGVTRFVDVGRSLRLSMAQIQKDLREVVEIMEIDRMATGTMKRLVFRVPTRQAITLDTVTYEYAKVGPKGKPVFKRNGREFFEEGLIDFQIYPFTLADAPREVRDTVDYSRIHLIKVKLTFLPGANEFQRVATQRTFAFTIYPRVANAHRRSVLGRFNLLSGRFGLEAGRAGPDPTTVREGMPVPAGAPPGMPQDGIE